MARLGPLLRSVQHLLLLAVRVLVVAAAVALASLLPRPTAVAAAACGPPVAAAQARTSGYYGGTSSASSCSSAARGSTGSITTATEHLPSTPAAAGRHRQHYTPHGIQRRPVLGDLAAAPHTASVSSAAAEGAAAEHGGPAGSAAAAPSSAGAAAHGAPGSPTLDPEVLDLAQRAGISPQEAASVLLFERARPSVVNITHMRAMQNFNTLDIHKMPYGQGSGFIWDARGHVVTNYHIVKGTAEVKVTLHDHSTYTAKVVGYDVGKDVAVLRLSMPKSKFKELQPVSLGRSSGLLVGQAVAAVGNPWGLDHTFTQGVVSGLGRELSVGLHPIKNVIQTDCAINPGNTGGVLLDSKGCVVGMNVAIVDAAGKGSFSGVSFAVPLDSVRGLIDQILMYGRTIRPALGITMAPAQILAQAGVDGVLVLEVPPGSPAHAAGLRATHRDIFGDIVLGDIITSLDAKPVRSYADLYAALDERRVGDRVKLELMRDGKQASVTVTLGERQLGVTDE